MSDSTAAPEEMTRGELEARVRDLETRTEELTELLEDLRSNAGKDRAAIHKRISELEETLDERLDAQAERLDSLEGHVTNADSGERKPATKKEHAETVTRNEALRVANKGLRGGAIDYPTVRDIAERQYGTKLYSGTVYAAFETLATKWECFTVHEGGDGPNTKNKHLRVERDAIPPALENLAEESAEGGGVRREGN